MKNLPFPPDKPLFDTIRKKYLLDVLKWLGDFHDPTSKTFLGAKTGSTWGVGYALICLFQAKAIYLESELFPGGFDQKANQSIEFLVKKATFGTETCNWEGNIWDTAVITRALMLYCIEYSESANEVRKSKVCEKSLKWLCLQLANWHDIRYTLGITELSQILRTLVVAQEIIPDELGRISAEIQEEENHPDVLESLVEEIVHSAKLTELTSDGKSEQVVAWDEDVFGTAETIVSLSRYVTSKATFVNQNLKKEILDLIGQALRFIELQQRDGRWGIEEETAVALRAYMVGHRAWGKPLEPEPHIVFKALRYLCDAKTVFPDGSIAHEMEPTIYYTLALIETLKGWRLPDGLCDNKPAIDLYDFILWNTPARSTYERLLRTKAESEASILRELNDSLTNRLVMLSKQLGFWQSTLYIIVWFSLLVFFVILSNSISTTPISVPIGIKVTDWQVFIALTVAWVTLGVAVYRILMNRRKINKT